MCRSWLSRVCIEMHIDALCIDVYLYVYEWAAEKETSEGMTGRQGKGVVGCPCVSTHPVCLPVCFVSFACSVLVVFLMVVMPSTFRYCKHRYVSGKQTLIFFFLSFSCKLF